MSDELPIDLRPVVDFFGLTGTAPVIKDFHVVRAIAVLAALDATPFTLVFGGGTALARAHGLVRRMSEDVDFKVVPGALAPPSKSALRRALGTLRDRVTAAFVEAGFVLDAITGPNPRARDENRYLVWQLPYAGSGTGVGLRPTIQVELSERPLRLPSVMRSVSSFVAEAAGRAPEVAEIACVSLTETAAEKLVSLTRRTAMDAAGLSRDPDPTLVRHIYDLHAMRAAIDDAALPALVQAIALADAAEFGNQDPAYAADITGTTRAALRLLHSDPQHRARYAQFEAAMVYGERAAFDEALATVMRLTDRAFAGT